MEEPNMIRVTIACPEAMRQIGNQLAVQLGLHPDDVHTYDSLEWHDAKSNLYAAASAVVTKEWLAKAIRAAEGLATVWQGEGETPPATSDTMTVIIGMEGLAALEAMGLTRIVDPV
jgi:hypothetical protein